MLYPVRSLAALRAVALMALAEIVPVRVLAAFGSVNEMPVVEATSTVPVPTFQMTNSSASVA